MNALICYQSKRFRRWSTIWLLALFLLVQWMFWRTFSMADLANRIGDLLGFFAITLLFGGVAALAIYHSLKRKPYLIVDAEGLQSPNTGIPLITWYDISEIRRRRDLWRHEYLDLYLQHEDEYIKRLSGTRQRQAKLSRKLGDPVFSLIITSLDVPAEQIYQAIQQHLLSARERA